MVMLSLSRGRMRQAGSVDGDVEFFVRFEAEQVANGLGEHDTPSPVHGYLHTARIPLEYHQNGTPHVRRIKSVDFTE